MHAFSTVSRDVCSVAASDSHAALSVSAVALLASAVAFSCEKKEKRVRKIRGEEKEKVSEKRKGEKKKRKNIDQE